MTQEDADVSRIRSLIFESVSRTEVFETLLGEVDELMRLPQPDTLTELSPDFVDASAAAGRAATAGYGVPEIRFTLDREGKVQNGTATAIALFGLVPGEDLSRRLGENGQDALKALTTGKRVQAMFTLFANPQSRPILVFAQRTDSQTIDAYAILLRWNNAIAPYLRDGFALTETEIDLVGHVFRGVSPKEIARQRDRSLETVRTQLRTICRKTDTHGIGDLVHLVYGLIATLPHLQTEDDAAARGQTMVKLPSGRIVDLETSGAVGGAPLLFLHGCLGGRRLPPVAVDALSERRIIAPARPGHGQSKAEDGSPLSLAETTRDLIALLDHLGTGAVDVLSYDLGACHALMLAHLAPQLVSSVTCLAPVPPLTGWKDLMALPKEQRVFPILSRFNPAAARYMAQLGGQRLLRNGPEGFGDIVFAGADFDKKTLSQDTDIQELFWHGHAWHTERGPEGFLADAVLSAQRWDEELDRLNMPVSFLIGAQDQNVPKTGLAALAKITGARVVEVENAGHSILHAAPRAWLGHMAAQTDFASTP